MMLPHMIPYAEPFYFLLAIALVPIVLSLLIWEKITSLSISSDTFLLFVSFGGNYWQQGAALIGYVCGRRYLYGAILFIGKGKSDRMVLPPLF